MAVRAKAVARSAEEEVETAAVELCLSSLCGICDGAFVDDLAHAGTHHDLALDSIDCHHGPVDAVKASAVERAVVGKRCPIPPATSCRTKHNEASMVLPSFCKPCISMERAWSSTLRLGYGQGTADPGCDVHQE